MSKYHFSAVATIFNACILIWIPISGNEIIALCSSLACLGLYYILSDKTISIITLLIYLLIAIFVPSFFLFIGIVSVGIFESLYNNRSKLLFTIYLLLIVVSIVLNPITDVYDNTILVYFIVFSCVILTACGVWNTSKIEDLQQSLKTTKDDQTEITYLLKDRNKSLLEKQNYEIYAATLRERNRIAREIHDNVGHLLTRTILITGAIKAINKQENLNSSIESLDEALNIAMSTIRESVHDLHNDSINLNEALTTLIDEFTFCPVEFYFNCCSKIPKEVSFSFIAIVKEALSNIIKHSNADNVKITVREHPGLYQLIVEDNGKCSPANIETDGIGLINIRDRVNHLYGNLYIHRDDGFKIFITVPKKNTCKKEVTA